MHGHFLTATRSLRSVTIPSYDCHRVVGQWSISFQYCGNLSEVILLGGERLLDQEFLARGIFSDKKGLLLQGALDEFLTAMKSSFEEPWSAFKYVNRKKKDFIRKLLVAWSWWTMIKRLPEDRSADEMWLDGNSAPVGSVDSMLLNYQNSSIKVRNETNSAKGEKWNNEVVHLF